MVRAFTSAFALPLVAMFASPAMGATYMFSSEVETPSSDIQFSLPGNFSPTLFDSTSFTVTGVKVHAFSTDVGPYDDVRDFTFYVTVPDPNGELPGSGGFDRNYRLYGDQLFTGSTAHPTFKLGDFDLFTEQGREGGVSISLVPDAVPEVSTWAMMILGMSAVGLAMRRRRHVRTTVSFS